MDHCDRDTACNFVRYLGAADAPKLYVVRRVKARQISIRLGLGFGRMVGFRWQYYVHTYVIAMFWD